MDFHIDIPPPHVDIPPPHVDVPPPHVDVPVHIDVPPPHVDVPVHIDVPPPHVDVPVHIDVPPPHVDVPVHIDVPPPHVDIPPPHVDIPPPHVDIPPPHVDIPPPHVDIPPPHVDIPAPHIDIPKPHIDVGHADLGHVDLGHADLGHIDFGGHADIPPPPHVDAAPPHVDVGYNHWWQNWPRTHAYIAKKMFFPTSVDEIASGVRKAEADNVPLRAVGGGWSFSDAPLPGMVATGRPNVQVSDSIDQFLPLAEGFPGDDQPSIASIDASNDWLIGYDENNVRLLGGAQRHVPQLVGALTGVQPQPAYLMNTRSLKSTLQAHLQEILSADAIKATQPGASQKFYFHVEGGITMEELGPLLDSQSPRLQLQASGGNPGATLAGSLSTATHGAEFNLPLLIDRVKAVHFVGPGGQQWWIEGNTSIADAAKLQHRYPGLDPAHIIAGTAPVNGLLPQDWLNAVVVSMGCMGVIYSVVLEVFPLSGSQEVTTQTTWLNFLGKALPSLTIPQILGALRNPADPLAMTVSDGIKNAITSGMFSNGLISAGMNLYADLAFNPNPAPKSSKSLSPGDWDCWIVNRQTVRIPFDPQPPGGGGITKVVDGVFREIGNAFAIKNNPGNLANLVRRLADVYGVPNPFHVDIPLHVDIPSPHIDLASPHIDVPSPHIDVPSPHIDVPSPHIDVPSPHIDVGHVDLHIDISAPLHVDTSFSPHIDIPSPHIDVPSPHIDVPSPHIDVPSPHIDVPSPHIDIPSPHIDVGHVDINGVLGTLVNGLANPFAGVLIAVLGFVPEAALVLEGLILAGLDLAHLVSVIGTIASSHDTLDVALDAVSKPLADAKAMDLAQPFLSGILASTLGTANDAGLGVFTGTSVGSVGFPSSGLLGAGIEIAMPLETAFGFMQTQILDKMDPNKPFFGYVSVRITPQTSTLLGMQQWPTSVMIEVVSFGDAWGIQFISQLQAAALAHINQGKDAMLHWGLENDQMTAAHLNNIPALQNLSVAHGAQPPLSKLAAFKLVRALLAANNGRNPPTLFRAFNNSFTARLNLG
jgi:hypothetical protein